MDDMIRKVRPKTAGESDVKKIIQRPRPETVTSGVVTKKKKNVKQPKIFPADLAKFVESLGLPPRPTAPGIMMAPPSRMIYSAKADMMTATIHANKHILKKKIVRKAQTKLVELPKTKRVRVSKPGDLDVKKIAQPETATIVERTCADIVEKECPLPPGVLMTNWPPPDPILFRRIKSARECGNADQYRQLTGLELVFSPPKPPVKVAARKPDFSPPRPRSPAEIELLNVQRALLKERYTTSGAPDLLIRLKVQMGKGLFKKDDDVMYGSRPCPAPPGNTPMLSPSQSLMNISKVLSFDETCKEKGLPVVMSEATPMTNNEADCKGDTKAKHRVPTPVPVSILKPARKKKNVRKEKIPITFATCEEEAEYCRQGYAKLRGIDYYNQKLMRIYSEGETRKAGRKPLEYDHRRSAMESFAKHCLIARKLLPPDEVGPSPKELMLAEVRARSANAENSSKPFPKNLVAEVRAKSANAEINSKSSQTPSRFYS